MLMFCYHHAAGNRDGGYSVRDGDYFAATDAQAAELLRIAAAIPVDEPTGLSLARPLMHPEFTAVAKRLLDRPTDLARLILGQRFAIKRFAVPADRLQIGGTPWSAAVKAAVLDQGGDEREELAVWMAG